MSILGWIVLGALAGWIASALLSEEQGCLLHIIVGIVGAVFGGLVFSQLGQAGITGFNLWSLSVAILGSVIFLGILRLLRGDRSRRR